MILQFKSLLYRCIPQRLLYYRPCLNHTLSIHAPNLWRRAKHLFSLYKKVIYTAMWLPRRRARIECVFASCEIRIERSIKSLAKRQASSPVFLFPSSRLFIALFGLHERSRGSRHFFSSIPLYFLLAQFSQCYNTAAPMIWLFSGSVLNYWLNFEDPIDGTQFFFF